MEKRKVVPKLEHSRPIWRLYVCFFFFALVSAGANICKTREGRVCQGISEISNFNLA